MTLFLFWFGLVFNVRGMTTKDISRHKLEIWENLELLGQGVGKKKKSLLAYFNLQICEIV